MNETKEVKPSPIQLSHFTNALISNLAKIQKKQRPDDMSKLMVSQAVSFFAILYEKIRNAVEYREDHLVRRAATERILKRRLMMNPQGNHEAENLLRELLWARYFPNGSLGGEDVAKVQDIIDKYILIKKLIVVGREQKTQQYLYDFLIEMLSAEIEEFLTPESTQRNADFNFFIYQVSRQKIVIEGLSEEQRDAFFLTALEKAYRRNDKATQRYHLFSVFYKPIQSYTQEELHTFSTKLPLIFKKIDDMIASPYVDSLVRFTRKQLPPFLILFSIMKTKAKEASSILSDKTKLWNEVDLVCREKYQFVKSRMRTLAFKSFIYIFLTKMVFALILEYPLSLLIYKEVNMVAIAINSIFPAFLMLFIISFFRVPDENNTKKIFQRLIEIIDLDKNYETRTAYMPKKTQVKRPLLIFGFTIFYSITFIVTLLLIYKGLMYINFNLISVIIFVFFVSVVTFFSYRIKQVTSEYRLEEKEGVLTPIVDFFFMPVLSLGKFFSSEIAKLNFFIFIFDFLIESPFKLIFEVVEEWTSFVRKRKEEII